MFVYIALVLLIVLTVIIIARLFLVPRHSALPEVQELKLLLQALQADTARIEISVKNEIAANRREATENAKEARLELSNSLKEFGSLSTTTINNLGRLQQEQLQSFSEILNNLATRTDQKLSLLTTTIDQKLSEANNTNNENGITNRKEIRDALQAFKTDFSKSVEDFNNQQSTNFFALLKKQSEQNTLTDSRLHELRQTLEKKIGELQTGNEKKLDEMRATVDEKLQKTLETRLGDSFKMVSERLEAVHKGLGDMQQLATGVGDLKRVLTNVKTRGIMGEYQLENLLDQLLTPEQFAKNVKTKEGSNANVEFAVKLPGRHDKEKVVWLPIDSKFPKEAFELLMEAYEQGTPDTIEGARRSFTKGIKNCAADICGKYIDPPNTTDFAILFLPFESLYAEVLRTPGLFETIQRECKIIITGPTTLSAILNSLQMGFKTLAIEKRSGEVWELLGAVKTEFSTFGGILDKTQKKLQEASNVIESASKRSRAIERKLRSVQELPAEPAIVIEQAIGEQDRN